MCIHHDGCCRVACDSPHEPYLTVHADWGVRQIDKGHRGYSKPPLILGAVAISHRIKNCIDSEGIYRKGGEEKTCNV